MYIDDGGPTGTLDPNWMNKAAEKLVKETPEGIFVDWNKYWETCSGRYGNWEVQRAFVELLLEKGVLSQNPDGHFLVMVHPSESALMSLVPVGPFSTSPVTVGTVMFFTKLEYAKEWRDGWPYFQGARSEYQITQLSVHDEGSSPLVPKQDKIAA